MVKLLLQKQKIFWPFSNPRLLDREKIKNKLFSLVKLFHYVFKVKTTTQRAESFQCMCFLMTPLRESKIIKVFLFVKKLVNPGVLCANMFSSNIQTQKNVHNTSQGGMDPSWGNGPLLDCINPCFSTACGLHAEQSVRLPLAAPVKQTNARADSPDTVSYSQRTLGLGRYGAETLGRVTKSMWGMSEQGLPCPGVFS